MVGRTARVLGLLISLIALAGCEPRTTSPISGRPVTAAQLDAELDRYVAGVKAQDAADKAEADRKISEAQAVAEAALSRMQGRDIIDAADIKLDLARMTNAALGVYQVKGEERARAMAGLQDQVQGAKADLQRQADVVAGLLNFGGSVAGAVPGPWGGIARLALEGVLGSGLVGTTVLASVRKRKSQQAQNASEAATAEASASQEAMVSLAKAIDEHNLAAGAGALTKLIPEAVALLHPKAIDILNAHASTMDTIQPRPAAAPAVP